MPKADKKTKSEPVKAQPAAQPDPLRVLAKRVKEWLPKGQGRKTWLMIGGCVALALIVIYGIFWGLIYKAKSTNQVVAAAARIPIIFPAEKVNGRYVSYSEYLFALSQLQHLCDYSKSNNLTPQPWCGDKKQEEQTALDELRERPIVKALFVKYNITVSKKELDDSVKQVVDSTGGEAKVRQVLRELYGWSFNDFRFQVQYQLARQKLADKIQTDDTVNAAAKAKAEEILAKAKAGADFAKLAKQYSQDSASASSGGDLNFFGKGKMVPEFEAVAFALKKGQIADHVVKTKYGYHIIKVTDKKKDQVRASHILIKSVDFESYLKDLVDKANVTRYIKL